MFHICTPLTLSLNSYWYHNALLFFDVTFTLNIAGIKQVIFNKSIK